MVSFFRQPLVVILCRCMSVKAAPDCNSGIVKDDTPGNTAVILEGMDSGIQKTLQILPLVGDDIRRTAVAEPGPEEIEDDLLTIQVNGASPQSIWTASPGAKRRGMKAFVSLRAARIS